MSRIARLLLPIASLTLFSPLASAVGLGKLSLESGLNQPFKASIQLLDAKGMSESELQVKLADDKEFVRKNMGAESLFRGLRFTLDLAHKGGPVVLVSSDKAIKEPALTFLVELSWPQGKVMRSYTVLLDQPARH